MRGGHGSLSTLSSVLKFCFRFSQGEEATCGLLYLFTKRELDSTCPVLSVPSSPSTTQSWLGLVIRTTCFRTACKRSGQRRPPLFAACSQLACALILQIVLVAGPSPIHFFPAFHISALIPKFIAGDDVLFTFGGQAVSDAATARIAPMDSARYRIGYCSSITSKVSISPYIYSRTTLSSVGGPRRPMARQHSKRHRRDQ
jgi:hypothetical protein